MSPGVTIQICNWPLVPSWVAAFAIGMISGVVCWRLGPHVVGSRFYAVSFFTYAVMMTGGLVMHCFFTVECENGAKPSYAYLNWILTTATLTSTIAVNFLFNGLVDIGYVSEDSKKPWIAFGLCFCALAFAYVFWGNLTVLYNDVIFVCCGLYLPIQLYRIFNSGTCAGWQYLTLAGVTGAIGFAIEVVNPLACYLCLLFGPWIQETAWYYCADLAMFFMLKYFLASRPATRAGPLPPRDDGLAYAPLQLVPL